MEKNISIYLFTIYVSTDGILLAPSGCFMSNGEKPFSMSQDIEKAPSTKTLLSYTSQRSVTCVRQRCLRVF